MVRGKCHSERSEESRFEAMKHNDFMVRLHQHAKERLIERGATEDEVIATVKLLKKVKLFQQNTGVPDSEEIFLLVAHGEGNNMRPSRLRLML
jgi:predicted PolB exonuclease-like 3'-5' exonuclease